MAKLTLYDAPRSMGIRGRFIEPTQESINAIEDYIRWCEKEVPHDLPIAMGHLVRLMAILNQGVARELSFGRDDPNQEHPDWAWRVPVRRISGLYFASWKVRMVNRHTAELYNDSREAYFIEFGINPRGEGRRVRRPIRKLSLHKTMKLMMTTQAYHRIWAEIFADPKRRFKRGPGFTQILQSPAGGHSRWEEISPHDAMSVMRRAEHHGHSTFPAIRMVRKPGYGNVLQIRRQSRGQGRYTGPTLGRRLP